MSLTDRIPLAARLTLALLTLGPAAASAQSLAPGIPSTARQQFPGDPEASVPDLRPLLRTGNGSELADIVSRFAGDDQTLRRKYDLGGSAVQRARRTSFLTVWRERLKQLPFDKLSQEGKIDYVLLDSHLVHELDLQALEQKQRAETQPLLPFGDKLRALQQARRELRTVDSPGSARVLAEVTKVVDSLRTLLESPPRPVAADTGTAARTPRAVYPKVTRTVANRAAEELDQLRGLVNNWFRYYSGYDPMFTWWVTNPQQKLDQSLQRYAQAIRQRLLGITPPAAQTAGGAPGQGGGGGNGGPNRMAAAANEPIIGDPIGAEGLASDLRHAMIPYTPEELIAIAEREYAFSESEAKKAAREMGFGDDWKAAMEKVKQAYVEPGRQPDLIRDLANEAEAFFDKHDWVTIPALAREDWAMEMLSPERQRVSPFFLGGQDILVSYPTVDMTQEEKEMSLRGNNPHFSRAVVFHELNPGHHLQGFMSARYNAHRRVFGTPFWNEGNSLYWEMFLWDHGFHVRPEDRLGALAWRMHRSARIVFSLSFHIGKMTPEQCIEYLADKVPFERANAEAEVRRSFNGSYPPIYQAAYMLGGLQQRALYQELVTSGKMTDRQFHDGILQGGTMPIAMVRARLAGTPLTREGAVPWRFAERLPAPKPFAR